MARFSDLPDEMILTLVSHLEPQASLPRSYYDWPQTYDADSKLVRRCLSDVRSLSCCTRRLHALLEHILYHNLIVLGSTRDAKEVTATLVQLNNNEGLKYRVKSIYITRPRNNDLKILFWEFPNLQLLSIYSFTYYSSMFWSLLECFGTSPVTKLYLLNCSAYDLALTQLFRWPKQLEELWYDADPSVQIPGVQQLQETSFSCQKFVQACKPFVSSLKKLVFSPNSPASEAPYYNDIVDLSKFDKLTSLCFNEIFLKRLTAGHAICEHLPRSLQDVEVFLDDLTFLTHEPLNGSWLARILERKWELFPDLTSIRIICEQWCEGQDQDNEQDEDSEDESDSEHDQDDMDDRSNAPEIVGQDDYQMNIYWHINDAERTKTSKLPGIDLPDPSSRLPSGLMTAFIKANVSFSVFRDSKRRFRHTLIDDDGFTHIWEDTWSPETEDK